MTMRILVLLVAVFVFLGSATMCRAGGPPPPAPQNLSAVAVTANRVDLFWTDQATGEQGYLVQRRTTDTAYGDIGSTGPDAETFEDTGVVANTTYYYQVGVIEGDTGRVRAWSNEAIVTTAISPPLPPDGLLAVAVSPSRIDLTWNDASTTERDFLIQRNSGSGFGDLAAVPADTRDYVDVGVLGGSTYTYRVCARDSGGNSTWSNSDTVVAALPRTAMQIGMERWYEGIETGDAFPAGLRPARLLFDGAHIWVTNAYDTTVTKFRAADGKELATIDVGEAPCGIGFDGTKIWVGSSDDILYVFDADDEDGLTMRTVSAGGDQPGRMAFDGHDMWVANSGSNNVVEFDADTLQARRTVSVPGYPSAIVCDGTHIWVCREQDDYVRRIDASGDDPNAWIDYRVGNYPWGITFDGANVWVANRLGSSVTKLRAWDGADLGEFPAGPDPWDVSFDGANIWVVNHGAGMLTKLRAADAALVDQIDAPTWLTGIAFDGANMWVCDPNSNQVVKR